MIELSNLAALVVFDNVNQWFDILNKMYFQYFFLSSKIDNTLDNPVAIQKEDKQASRVFDNEKENRFSERRHRN